jgi:putative flippase GtrA
MQHRLRKLARYASVSAISTVTSLTLLAILVAVAGMSAGWANVIATAVGTVPSFELNRRWVWGKSGRRSAGGEMLPFVALSFVELGLSTLAVHAAGTWAGHQGWSTTGRAVADDLANLAVYGSLWAAQFVLLDRVLFRHRRAAGPQRGPVPVRRSLEAVS